MKKRLLVLFVAILACACLLSACSKKVLVFETNGGTPIGDMEVTSEFQMPADPQKQDCVFVGWYLDADLTDKFEFASASDITSSLVLYAKWVPSTYVITYNYQGAQTTADTPATHNVVYGQSYNLEVPTKTGYTFTGWYSAASGDAVKYTNQHGISVSNYNEIKNITVYARWSPVSVGVQYNYQGATGGNAQASKQLVYDASYTLAVPTRTGFTFGGWYTQENGGGTKYANADGSSVAPWTQTESITLYAKWVLTEIDALTISGYTSPVAFTGNDITLTANITHPLLQTATYKWYKDNVLLADTASSVVLNEVSDSGVYKVVATIAFGGQLVTKEATQTVAINAATMSVTAEAYNAQYDGAAHSISVTAPAGANVEYSLDGNTWSAKPEYTNVTATTTVYYKVSKANYATVEGNRTVTITAREVTLTIENKTSAYNASLVELTYRVTTGSVVNADDLNVILTKASGSNAGKYAITGRYESNNYAVSFVDGEYTISKITPIITTAPTGSGIYVGQSLTSSIISGGEASVAGQFDWTVTTTTPTVSGSQSVTFTPDDDTNYNTVTLNIPVTVTQLTLAYIDDAGRSQSNVNYGAQIALSDFPVPTARTGFSVKWDATEAITVTSSVEVNAVYTIINYDITYNIGAATVNGVNPVKYNVNSDEITLINPEMTGYTFNGWLGTGIDEASTAVVIAAGSIGERSYTANWTINSYTVSTVSANGSVTISVNDLPVEEGASVAYASQLKFTAVADDGFAFIRWEVLGHQAATDNPYETTLGAANYTISAIFAAVGERAYKVEHYYAEPDGETYDVITKNYSGEVGTLASAAVNVREGFSENLLHANRVASGEILEDGSLVLKLYYSRLSYNVTFIDDGENRQVSVIYGGTLATGNFVVPTARTGFSVEWDVTEAITVTTNVEVNAVYTLNAPNVLITGTSTATYGTDVVLSANATHALAVSYQWYKGESLLQGKTTSSITLSEVAESGSYKVIVSVTSNGQTQTAEATQTVAINAATMSVTAEAYNAQYDGAAHSISVTAPAGANVEYSLDGNTWSTKPEYTNVTATTTVYYKVSKANYATVEGNRTVTITAREVTLTIENKTSAYNASLVELTYRVTTGSVVNADDLNVILTKASGNNAGKYAITGRYENNNYAVSFVDGEYTISKITPIITTAPTGSGIYVGQSLTSSIISGGEASVAGQFDWTVTTTTPTVSGSQSVTFTPDDDTNYNTVTLNIPVTVTQLTVTFKHAGDDIVVNVSYGGTVDKTEYTPQATVGYTAAWPRTPSTSNVTSSVEVNAVYTAITYTVNYNYQGATGGTQNEKVQVNYASAVTLAIPTRVGYVFGGWYTQASGEGTCISGADGGVASWSQTSDLTIYAKWTIRVTTVNYNYQSATGGNGAATILIAYDSITTLAVPTKTGYAFVGWYSQANGAGVRYTEEDGVLSAAWNVDEDAITLYAHWIDASAQRLSAVDATTVKYAEGGLFFSPVTPPVNSSGLNAYEVAGYSVEINGGIPIETPYASLTIPTLSEGETAEIRITALANIAALNSPVSSTITIRRPMDSSVTVQDISLQGVAVGALFTNNEADKTGSYDKLYAIVTGKTINFTAFDSDTPLEILYQSVDNVISVSGREITTINCGFAVVKGKISGADEIRYFKVSPNTSAMTIGADYSSRGTTIANLNDATKVTYLDKTVKNYTVGYGSVFIPDVAAEDGFEFVYSLREKVGEAYVDVSLSAYATEVNNNLQFNESAGGKTFELTVKSRYRRTLTPVRMLITVNEGVNVYTQEELQNYYEDLRVTKINLLRNITLTIEYNAYNYAYNWHYDTDGNYEYGKPALSPNDANYWNDPYFDYIGCVVGEHLYNYNQTNGGEPTDGLALFDSHGFGTLINEGDQRSVYASYTPGNINTTTMGSQYLYLYSKDGTATGGSERAYGYYGNQGAGGPWPIAYIEAFYDHNGNDITQLIRGRTTESTEAARLAAFELEILNRAKVAGSEEDPDATIMKEMVARVKYYDYTSLFLRSNYGVSNYNPLKTSNLEILGNYFVLDGTQLPKFELYMDEERSIPTAVNGWVNGDAWNNGVSKHNTVEGIFAGYANNVGEGCGTLSITFNDMTMLGNDSRPDGYDDEGNPVEGLAAYASSGFVNLQMRGVDVYLNNGLFKQATTNLSAQWTDGVITKTLLYNTFDWNLYYGTESTMELIDSYVGYSGGAAIGLNPYMSDPNNVSAKYPKLILQDTFVSNWVAGSETWFELYGLSGAAALVKETLDNQVGVLSGGTRQVTVVDTTGETGGAEFFNFALLVRGGSDQQYYRFDLTVKQTDPSTGELKVYTATRSNIKQMFVTNPDGDPRVSGSTFMAPVGDYSSTEDFIKYTGSDIQPTVQAAATAAVTKYLGDYAQTSGNPAYPTGYTADEQTIIAAYLAGGYAKDNTGATAFVTAYTTAKVQELAVARHQTDSKGCILGEILVALNTYNSAPATLTARQTALVQKYSASGLAGAVSYYAMVDSFTQSGEYYTAGETTTTSLVEVRMNYGAYGHLILGVWHFDVNDLPAVELTPNAA